MKSLNRVELIGRLGREPEIRYTQSGLAICNLSVATEHSVRKGQDWESTTTWHTVVAWRDLAERAATLEKGDLVYIQGRLIQESWTDQKSGDKRYAVKIVADTILLVAYLGKADNERQASQTSSGGGSGQWPDDVEDSDLPF